MSEATDRVPGAPGPEAPIGVFDSGVGGLTVLAALTRRLPGESTIYLGDTARVPYGPKSPETVRRYADEAVDFLLARGSKLLVLACNTVSARALPDLADRSPVPVVGVIEPGARHAVARSSGGQIGVIGTRGTIESGAYERAIRALRGDAGVRSIACPLFVPLVEEGWTEGEISRMIARTYLDPLLEDEIDTLVLGCTHYPVLKKLLAEVIGDGIGLVDSAEATAAVVSETLDERRLGRSGGEEESPPERRFYVTDDAERFRLLANRITGGRLEHLEQIVLPSAL